MPDSLSRFVLSTLVFWSACGSDSSGPDLAACKLKLELEPAPVLMVGRSTPLHAKVSFDTSSSCRATGTLPSEVNWSSSRADIIRVTSAGDTVATALALQIGTSIVQAALKSQPAISDTITVAVASQASVIPALAGGRGH